MDEDVRYDLLVVFNQYNNRRKIWFTKPTDICIKKTLSIFFSHKCSPHGEIYNIWLEQGSYALDWNEFSHESEINFLKCWSFLICVYGIPVAWAVWLSWALVGEA